MVIAEAKSEMVRFGKGSGKPRKSPNQQGKFIVLGTIEEAVNETTTTHNIDQSIRDDESRVGSTNLRSSNILDLDDSGGVSHHRNSM